MSVLQLRNFSSLCKFLFLNSYFYFLYLETEILLNCAFTLEDMHGLVTYVDHHTYIRTQRVFVSAWSPSAVLTSPVTVTCRLPFSKLYCSVTEVQRGYEQLAQCWYATVLNQNLNPPPLNRRSDAPPFAPLWQMSVLSFLHSFCL